MSRLLLFVVSLLAWAGVVYTVLSAGTAQRMELAQSHARAKLKSQGAEIALAAESLERTLLDDTREAALGMGVGAALDRLSGEPSLRPAKKGKRAAAAPAEAVIPAERAAEMLKDVREAFDDLTAGSKRTAMVFDKRGRIIVTTGPEKIGTTLKNAADVGGALEGVSQLVLASGKVPRLVAYAPTIGRDGLVNGAIALHQPIDAGFCAGLAAKSGVGGFALVEGSNVLCATAGFEAGAPQQGEAIRPGPLAGKSLMFADANTIGVLVARDDNKIPVLLASAVVAEDLRGELGHVADWQQQTLMLMGGLLLAMWVLIALALIVATRPADAIANHLALIHQGGKVPALSERKFQGSFKRIVKNLDTLLEKRDQRPGGPSLQPISALLAGSPEPAEQDMRFETAANGTLGQRKEEEAPSAPAETPRIQPMVMPQKSEPQRPVLSPLSPATFDLAPSTPIAPKAPPPALSGLFDEKTPIDEGILGRPPPPPPPDADALPPLPDLANLPKPSMNSGKAVSGGEADSALSDLHAVPSGIAPPDTPWDTPASAKAAGISEQDEEHYHQVFEEFLKIRAQCGEATSNLTYDKFVEKLKKSRDQVMQKQNTKIVRFQVYVKDGKAALKAVAAK